jgi:hypothetical protein
MNMSMQARFASIDITPKSPCVLAGDRFRTDRFTTVHSRLEMNAAFFQDAQTAFLIVSIDTLYAGKALKTHMQREAAAWLNVPPSQVLVCASHTHFAPTLDAGKPQLGNISPDYLAYVCEQASALIRQLAQQPSQAVRVSAAASHSDHAVNRRRYWPYPVLTRDGPRWGSMVMAPSPEGHIDQLVRSFWLYGADDELLAMIWNYACHPVCLPLEHAVSSEFPGHVRAAVRARHGDLPVLFLQGFCGDIRPNVAARSDLRTLLKTLLIGPRFGSFSLDGWTNWADGLARAVLDGERAGKKTPLGAISALESGLPVGDIFSGKADPDLIVFHGVSLGPDLRLLTISAEPAAEWGPMLRNGVVPVGYEGDVFGYLPTDTMVSRGGYEGGGFVPLFHGAGRMTENVDIAFATAVKECGMLADNAAPADSL